MIHLGIHYGHNATVAVVQDGKLIFCQSEERLNRIKNSTGFPTRTLDYVYTNICKETEVASATLFQESVFGYLFLKSHGFTSFQYGHYLAPQDSGRGFFRTSELQWQLGQMKARLLTERKKRLCEEAHTYFANALHLPRSRVFLVNHHLAHVFSLYPNVCGWGDALIFTLDGQGDGICATVSRLANGELQLLDQTDHRNSLGYYYSAITALMGMKSGEHEFKVMGLAPYAKRRYYMPLLEKLRKLLEVDDQGRWHSAICPTKLWSVLGSAIQYQRFDNIAGAIQELTEELIWKWIHHWIAKTGVANVAVAGGVFMNVKACQRLAESDKIDKLFVMPSAADESTAIGAAFWGAKKVESTLPLQPVADLYLGMEFTDQEAEAAFRKHNVSHRYEIARPRNINQEVASLLAENHVVARCSGRMEFGARALGNRSILANPSSFQNLEVINSAIKNRDFWMPFTPSILAEDMGRYIVRAERVFAPYMCLTFDSTAEARRDLCAAIHPRDKTVRPQCVLKEWNADYHELISAFKALTGIGGVLNTSFNLHGEPNVCSPEDAIHTMDESGLEYLAMGSFLLRKTSNVEKCADKMPLVSLQPARL